jgi:hypothetical protein
VAFIGAAGPLPTVSVADRNRTGRMGSNPAQAILAGGRSAGWLAGPAVQQALLSRRPAISLTSHGSDVLAWTDYGWTGRDGVTDYGGERITNVRDLDIVTVEALLQVLDTVPLPP